jgi:hypothetical protein
MAKSASYNTAGNRESLLDIITILEPESTPLTSLANKLNATGTFNEVMVDDLSVASFDGVNEGEDVTSFDNKAANRARIGNYVQKFRRSYAVSDIQEIVDTAGVASEYANATWKPPSVLPKIAKLTVAQARHTKLAECLSSSELVVNLLTFLLSQEMLLLVPQIRKPRLASIVSYNRFTKPTECRVVNLP